MAFKRVLYAPNVHQGGGKELLLSLITELRDDAELIFVFDDRLEIPRDIRLAGQVFRVKAKLFSRLYFEWKLKYLIHGQVRMLCMGNLPPFFAHNGEQHVFVQNRYLIDLLSLTGFSWMEVLRISMERWWLKSRAKYVTNFIVQTNTMADLLRRTTEKEAVILPFIGTFAVPQTGVLQTEKHYDYIYVASGEPHKNHEKLIEAWISLAQEGKFPSLCLTLNVNKSPKLCTWIERAIKKYSLKVILVGECPHEEIIHLYGVSRALIYPSLLESFGLPLVESSMLGIPILASNADYVRDVVVPSDDFDPRSAQSIAGAVANFSFNSSKLKVDLLTPEVFLKQTLYKGESIEKD